MARGGGGGQRGGIFSSLMKLVISFDSGITHVRYDGDGDIMAF